MSLKKRIRRVWHLIDLHVIMPGKDHLRAVWWLLNGKQPYTPEFYKSSIDFEKPALRHQIAVVQLVKELGFIHYGNTHGSVTWDVLVRHMSCMMTSGLEDGMIAKLLDQSNSGADVVNTFLEIDQISHRTHRFKISQLPVPLYLWEASEYLKERETLDASRKSYGA